MNNIFLNKFGINHNKINTILIKFGISKKKLSFKNKKYENIINKFLDLNLNKKEYFLKQNFDINLKILQNGSLKGYKKLRGLPSNNQRTKTNAKTNKKH